jgi:hypothetical protein
MRLYKTFLYQKIGMRCVHIFEKNSWLGHLLPVRSGTRGPFVSAKGLKTMVAFSFLPFWFPAQFANSFGLAQDRSSGGANSLRSNNAPPNLRSRLHGSVTPKARNKKNQEILNFIGLKRNCLAQ